MRQINQSDLVLKTNNFLVTFFFFINITQLKKKKNRKLKPGYLLIIRKRKKNGLVSITIMGRISGLLRHAVGAHHKRSQRKEACTASTLIYLPTLFYIYISTLPSHFATSIQAFSFVDSYYFTFILCSRKLTS